MKLSKDQLRAQHRQQQSDLSVWRSVTARMKEPLDKLFDNYLNEVEDSSQACCCVIPCIQSAALKSLIRTAVDDYHAAERDVNEQLLTVSRLKSRVVTPVGSPDHAGSDDDDDPDDSSQLSAPAALRQFADNVSRIAKLQKVKAMKRAELEAEIIRNQKELKTLQATFEADCRKLMALEADYRIIKRQFILLPCTRYDEYCRVIDAAVGELQDVVDGTSSTHQRRRRRRGRQAPFQTDVST